MKRPVRIALTVTNDLNFDQRMIRICTALQEAGYEVTLIGREHPGSRPLEEKIFAQKRLKLSIPKGKLMYFFFWLKLFFYLLFHKAEVICAIDLDTILPVYFASALKGAKRVYDAHELFTELKEVVTRPREKRLWDRIERFSIPRFPNGYTIGDCYAEEFRQKYGVRYAVVRNATVLKPFRQIETGEQYILYQGWVNEGRCFEELIPAMKNVDMPLVVCGEGNFFQQAKSLAIKNGVDGKISFKGYVPPAELVQYTQGAYIGITLFHGIAKSNVLSMANRFFDYMHHGVPQLCMRFPEYERVNEEFEIATLVNDPPRPDEIAEALNRLIRDEDYHQRLAQNCLKAREKYCWQNEEKVLLAFYQNLLNGNED
ncbi:MAG TPA: glycosyltransferase [Edaphocola sp.]|nr:glycosyltransferase [Edaphocola sp.]